jgi:hypothetical protein
MIKDIAARLMDQTKELGVPTRVVYLSKFRSHLRNLGVTTDLLKQCDAYRPEETKVFNQAAAARRVERADSGIVVGQLPDWLGMDTIDSVVHDIIIQLQDGKDPVGELMDQGTAKSANQAERLAQLLVFVSARPHELVEASPSDASSERSGKLAIVGEEAPVWAGYLKARATGRKVPYDPWLYSSLGHHVTAEHMQALLSSITSSNPTGRRRALKTLIKGLKPFGLTPRDLRAIGADYSAKRFKSYLEGTNQPVTALKLDIAKANALRHDKLPSDSALSAYQRVDAVQNAQPNAARSSAAVTQLNAVRSDVQDLVLGPLQIAFQGAAPEIQAQVLELLGLA